MRDKDTFICTSNRYGGACKGDGGAALVYRNTIIGIMSHVSNSIVYFYYDTGSKSVGAFYPYKYLCNNNKNIFFRQDYLVVPGDFPIRTPEFQSTSVGLKRK